MAKKTPTKPRNYQANEATFIQVNALKKKVAALEFRLERVELRLMDLCPDLR